MTDVVALHKRREQLAAFVERLKDTEAKRGGEGTLTVSLMIATCTLLLVDYIEHFAPPADAD